jgi:hypothetical protein
VNPVIGSASIYLGTVSSTPARPRTATLGVAITIIGQSAPRHSPATEQKDVWRVILARRILIWVGKIGDIIPENASLRVREYVSETGQREEVVRGESQKFGRVFRGLAHNKLVSVRFFLHDNKHTEALHSTGSPYRLIYAHIQGVQRERKDVAYTQGAYLIFASRQLSLTSNYDMMAIAVFPVLKSERDEGLVTWRVSAAGAA